MHIRQESECYVYLYLFVYINVSSYFYYVIKPGDIEISQVVSTTSQEIITRVHNIKPIWPPKHPFSLLHKLTATRVL